MSEEAVNHLQKVFKETNTAYSDFPMLVRHVLQNRYWEKRYDKIAKETIEFDTFEEFVRTSPIKGLGTTIETIKARLQVIANDKMISDKDRRYATECLVLMNDAVNEAVKPVGKPKGMTKEKVKDNDANSINIRKRSPVGDCNPEYIQRRLKKDSSPKAKKLYH